MRGGKHHFRWRKARSERGQISVLVGMVMMTFILFFAFVLNTGMLVNAKINLQNAADMAAYSGAAVQARQLTQISYLNYEMRRAYKMFLFRYYVLGNMAQERFPSAPGGTGDYLWSPDGTRQNETKVPAVCMVFNNNNNFCKIATLQAIIVPPPNLLDSISQTLANQLKAIENIRQDNCRGIGKTNMAVLLYWLWNFDPELTAALQNPDSKPTAQLIRGIVHGLGLIPKELLLRRRIQTLQEYVNAKPLKGLNKEQADQLRSGVDPGLNERAIQAYYSAFNTLGPSSFNDIENIQLDELLPEGPQGAALLALNEIKVGFDTYASDMRVGSCDANNNNTSNDPQDCVQCITPITIQEVVPVGVTKDPKILTYYSVRLQAKARVLFSPFGESITLKAYAAAQPFGSRIGPNFTSADFTWNAFNDKFCNPFNTSATSNGAGQTIPCQKKIPNLPIREGDSAQKGWNQADVLGAMYARLKDEAAIDPANRGNGAAVTPEAMKRTAIAAMAPNPIEAGKYNIPSDLNDDPFIRHFDEQRLHAFWAPVISPAKLSQGGGSFDEEVKHMIDQLTQSPAQGGAASMFNQAFKDNLKAGLSQYIAKLRQGQGENGEGMNIVRISDPYNLPPIPNNGQIQPITLPGDLLLKDYKKVKTSWNTVYDGEFRAFGRTGYSVKFVSFRTLMDKRGVTTNGTDTWSNVIPSDGEDTDADLQAIQH